MSTDATWFTGQPSAAAGGHEAAALHGASCGPPSLPDIAIRDGAVGDQPDDPFTIASRLCTILIPLTAACNPGGCAHQDEVRVVGVEVRFVFRKDVWFQFVIDLLACKMPAAYKISWLLQIFIAFDRAPRNEGQERDLGSETITGLS